MTFENLTVKELDERIALVDQTLTSARSGNTELDQETSKLLIDRDSIADAIQAHIRLGKDPSRLRHKNRNIDFRLSSLAEDNGEYDSIIERGEAEKAQLQAARQRAIVKAEDAAVVSYFTKLAVEFDALADRLGAEYCALRSVPGANNGDFFTLIDHLKNFHSNHAAKPIVPAKHNNLVLLKCLISHGKYHAAETAGFPLAEAPERLLDRVGIALDGSGGDPVWELNDSSDESRLPALPGEQRGLLVSLAGPIRDAIGASWNRVRNPFGSNNPEEDAE